MAANSLRHYTLKSPVSHLLYIPLALQLTGDVIKDRRTKTISASVAQGDQAAVVGGVIKNFNVFNQAAPSKNTAKPQPSTLDL